MKRKYILMFMYLLTSVCIFSIGFSSWTIVQNATIDTSGNIVAEDIFSDDKYIYLNDNLGDDNTGIDIFEFYDRCFITYTKDDNGVSLPTESETGELILYYVIDLKSWKEDIEDSKENKLTTKFTLSFASADAEFNILSYLTGEPTITTSVPFEISNYTNSTSCTFNLNMDLTSALASYDLTESTRYVYLEIAYTFNHAIGNSFTNDIYSHIIKDDFNFILKTEIEISTEGDINEE